MQSKTAQEYGMISNPQATASTNLRTNAFFSTLLYDFLNGKQLSRDRLIVIFLNLKYEYDDICKMLRRFQLPQLYPKNRRDYLIMTGIHKKLSVDKIDLELEQNGFSTLCPVKPDK